MNQYIFGNTNLGKVRTNNEDAFISEIIWKNNSYLAVVIDGVGGHEGGEIAAKIAKESIIKYLTDFQNGERLQLIIEAVNEANNAIVKAKQGMYEYRNMSCVLSACIVDLDSMQLHMAHVGDTRLYVYHNRKLEKISHDHSLVGYREEVGDLTEEEAMNHPQRNLISRDIGSIIHKPEDEEFIESATVNIHPNSTILLCSDGLTDLVTSKQIIDILNQKVPLNVMVDNLILEANNAGGKDNITIVLVKTPQTESNEELVITEIEKRVDNSIIQLNNNKTLDDIGDDKDVNKEVEKLHFPFSYLKFSLFLILGIAIGVLCTILYNKISRGTKETTVSVNINNQMRLDSIVDIQTLLKNNSGDTFEIRNADTIIICNPLIIYTDSLIWKQHKHLILKPKDSLICQTGLIFIGSDCKITNVDFSLFRVPTIDKGKNNKIIWE